MGSAVIHSKSQFDLTAGPQSMMHIGHFFQHFISGMIRQGDLFTVHIFAECFQEFATAVCHPFLRGFDFSAVIAGQEIGESVRGDPFFIVIHHPRVRLGIIFSAHSVFFLK